MIRSATATDQAFISEMQYAACFVPPGGAPFPMSILDDPAIAPYHRGFGSRPGDVGLIALDDDGERLGAAWIRFVVGFGFVDRDTPELGIAVVERARGRGIGTALLERLLARVPTCSLSVDRRNPAMRLYERLGFGVVGREGDAVTMLWGSR